jgi:anti-sigma regulatory factor (Ser/Thr protein kinase)
MANLAERAELMVSELVTNAIVHARSAPTVVARADGTTLRVEVHDRGSGTCTLRDPDETQDSGRGLRFVDSLAERWGSEANTRGKTVWFELARD